MIVFGTSEPDPITVNNVGAGAKALMTLEDFYWGDRTRPLEDPSGRRWNRVEAEPTRPL
jgi:uncharacterized glyoxalase superfamily protein PhnB